MTTKEKFCRLRELENLDLIETKEYRDLSNITPKDFSEDLVRTLHKEYNNSKMEILDTVVGKHGTYQFTLIDLSMTNKELIQTKQIENLISQAVLENISPTVFLGQICQLKIPISIEELDQYILPTENESNRLALMVALVEKDLLEVDNKTKKIILRQKS